MNILISWLILILTIICRWESYGLLTALKPSNHYLLATSAINK